MKTTIQITVNGEMRSADVDPRETLVDVLRDKLGVKSPKVGCGKGDCGACTVLLDGRAVRSCLILAVEANGHEVVTVEGLCRNGLTPLQVAFLRHNAFQCGYCAPGMVLAATELLARNPRPDDAAIREAIAGNLCRCTGYEPILAAIREVAAAGASPSRKPRRPARRKPVARHPAGRRP